MELRPPAAQRQGHYFQLKQDSLGIIFDLSLTRIPPTSRWQPGSTEQFPLLHRQTQALTRGPIH